MNSISQFDNHPDAESLNAFIEQALAAGEREQILVHMAACARCREIVFLAQQAAAEPVTQRDLPERTPSRAKQGWVGGWRWAWIPVAALAGMITIVAVQYGHHATEVGVARSVPSGQALTGGVAVAGKDELRNSRAGDTQVSSPRSSSSKRTDEALDEAGHGEIAQKKPAVRATEEQATNSLSIPARPGPEGLKDAREAFNKPSAVGGPMMASQVNQQQSAQQQELSGRQLQAARYSVAGGSGVIAGLEAKAKQPAAHGNVLAAPLAPPAQGVVLTAPAAASTLNARDEVAPVEKAKTIHLPSGLLAFSAATNQGRTVAIDSTGAVFLMDSAGTAWNPVVRQWTGRAMRVSVRDSSGGSGAVLTAPVSLFELVNDNDQTWTSQDGKTWVAKDLPQR